MSWLFKSTVKIWQQFTTQQNRVTPSPFDFWLRLGLWQFWLTWHQVWCCLHWSWLSTFLLFVSLIVTCCQSSYWALIGQILITWRVSQLWLVAGWWWWRAACKVYSCTCLYLEECDGSMFTMSHTSGWYKLSHLDTMKLKHHLWCRHWVMIILVQRNCGVDV